MPSSARTCSSGPGGCSAKRNSAAGVRRSPLAHLRSPRRCPVALRAPPALDPDRALDFRAPGTLARPHHGLHGDGFLRPCRVFRARRLRGRAHASHVAGPDSAGTREWSPVRAHARLRATPLHDRLQVALAHWWLGRHHRGAKERALVGGPVSGDTARVLLSRARHRRRRVARLLGARPLAVRPGGCRDPRERAQVRGARPRPCPLQADRVRDRRRLRGPRGRAVRAVPRLRVSGADVLGLVGPGPHDGHRGRHRNPRRSGRRRDGLHPGPGDPVELHRALDDLHGRDLRPHGDLPARWHRRHRAALARTRAARMSGPTLETRKLSRSFGALRAVADVDLSVEPGELRAIIGPNGAGKTTLFHLVSGLLRPTAGHVVFRGADISDVPEPERCLRGISRTFQITSLFGELSAVENVRMAIQLKGGGNFVLLGGRRLLAETERLARETLGSLGLHERSDALASTLPHGEQRLLEIAMALAQEPVLLLLDEPTQGLSSAETAATVAVIRRIARERHLTILLVEHDMDVVFNLADRVTVLNFGKVVAEGSPADVRANVDVQKAYLGEIPSLGEQARLGESAPLGEPE